MSDVSPLPLEGIRIVAIEQFGAGPWATMQLADLGADVIKVEDPSHGGDVGRYVPPFANGGDSLFFEAFNRGKRSIALDLRQPEGKRAFHSLVPQVDAVFCNLRGDQPERLGLRYLEPHERTPDVLRSVGRTRASA
jgi:crotonobetainyl-CoA:carnitine CoA-transferase CaiB-like acyl-CoA transferase